MQTQGSSFLDSFKKIKNTVPQYIDEQIINNCPNCELNEQNE